MNVWVVYMYLADYEGGPNAPDAVFADPADAMIWADEEFDLTKKWYDADVDDDGEFRRRIDKWYFVVVRPVEFFPFKCGAFIMGGPGHQSKHTCQSDWPHAIEDEHRDGPYEWCGTYPNTFNEEYYG